MRRKESKYWLRIADIQAIMECGRTRASQFMKMCNDDIEKHGKIVPMKHRTSRSWFLRLFNLEGEV